MPCDPNDLTVNPPPLPPDFSGAGNLGISLPDVPFAFPEIGLEDLTELFDLLGMILPPGTIKPILSPNFGKTPYDAIMSLLQTFMPFLMLYKFIMPVLNMILCIIEVLCALPPSPYKVAKLVRALRRLFRVCIPEFLALFPAFALIIMIISLLILLLTLIEYIITQLLNIIKQLLDNIKTLSKAASRLDNDSIIAITTKLGTLLCYLQNFFVLFGLINIIIEVIKAIIRLAFKLPPCDDSDDSDDGCCTPDVCPDFIKFNEDRNNNVVYSSSGTLQYLNFVGIDSGLSLPVGFPEFVGTLRQESWQFYDTTLTDSKSFDNITRAVDLPPGISQVFFPPETVYTESTNFDMVPYTVDMTIFYRPADFGRSDAKGDRNIIIKNCIVTAPPSDSLKNYENNFVSPSNGVLSLVGGTAYEEDGTTVFINPNTNSPYKLTTLIKLDSTTVIPPFVSLDDSNQRTFTNVSYNFRVNYNVLISEMLITVGCHPSLALDRSSVNAVYGAPAQANAALFADFSNNLPNVNDTTACVFNAITKLRENMSEETIAEFENTVTNCLNDLKSKTSDSLKSIMDIGFDPYRSDFIVDPVIQFTTRTIKVSVTLNESTGLNMANNVPADVGNSIASKITALTSFGEITNFIYDGTSAFTAEISSEQEGNGTIQVMYNGVMFSVLTNPSNIDEPLTVTPKIKTYTFVASSTGVADAAQRRDESDTANNTTSGNGG